MLQVNISNLTRTCVVTFQMLSWNTVVKWIWKQCVFSCVLAAILVLDLSLEAPSDVKYCVCEFLRTWKVVSADQVWRWWVQLLERLTHDPPPPPHTHTEHNALALYLHATSCTWQRSSSNDKIRMFIYTAVKYLFGTPWSERPSLASHCGDGIGPSVYGSGLAEPQFCLLSLPGSDLTLVHGPPCPPPPPKCPQMPPNAKSALYPNCLPKDHGYDCYARQ